MKRFHVHVSVANLADSVRFYSSLFGMEPSVLEPDYAKWMVDDPRLNFAISSRGGNAGVNHLGMQVDDEEELQGMRAQLAAADSSVTAEHNAHCCYAESNKYWATDPQGIAWETFHTLASIPVFGAARAGQAAGGAACCDGGSTALPMPATKARAGCCA